MSGTVRLSSVRLECGARAADEVDSDVRPKHARKVNGLYDIAVERVHVTLARRETRGLLSLFPRLWCFRRLRCLCGLLRASSAFRRGYVVRGSRRRRVLLLGIRRHLHTPCFDSRET